MRKPFLGFVLTLFFISCSGLKQGTQNNSRLQLKFINAIEIPYNQVYKNTKIGGLSGIDYHKKKELYYLISDERSQENSSRFYSATINICDDELKSINFQETTTLKNEHQATFGNWLMSPETAADPEDIRYNPKTNSLIWCSEGARTFMGDKMILQNPSVTFMDLKGNFKGQLKLPENLAIQKQNKGPRNNGSLEGIAFDVAYKRVYISLEEPLFEDGNPSTTTTGGKIRLYEFNVKTKENTAQYGYILEPIARQPNPEDSFAVNGISGILFYKKNQLLVLERSYSTGTKACTIKVFLCDFKKASNVIKHSSLKNQEIEFVSKKLILNLDDLGIFTDNIEGLTFGPELKNGNRSLILVSDNNFSQNQKTQLLLFEVLE